MIQQTLLQSKVSNLSYGVAHNDEWRAFYIYQLNGAVPKEEADFLLLESAGTSSLLQGFIWSLLLR
jgi:hypothetical protein